MAGGYVWTVLAKMGAVLLATLLVVGCGGTKGKLEAERAVEEFHQKLDRGDVRAIYAVAHPDLKAKTSEADFVTLLEAIRRKLGKTKKSEQVGWRVGFHNLNTDVSLTYKTAFDGGDAVESFRYFVEGPKAFLVGYNVNSPTLVIK